MKYRCWNSCGEAALIFVMVLLLAVPASVAEAASPQPISGNFAVDGVTPTSARVVGRNCIIEADVVFSFTGDLTGSFSSLSLRIVHRGPCDQPAAETFQGQGSYQGAVNDASGAFDFNFRGSADSQGNAQATMTVLQGSGALANLRGTIRLTGQTGVGGSYTGAVHFDP